MNNAENNIKKGLLKRQEALNKFRTHKEDFLLAKKRIKKDIEEVSIIWKSTVEELPLHEFDL
jgi:hypothetical protein